MKETILSIQQHHEKIEWQHMQGYKITTNLQDIKLLINDSQSCCENFGTFLSEEDTSDFIGSELISLSITDTALEKVAINHKDELTVYDGGVMFVNIETFNGLLQFVAYNCYNGYYGHEAKVISSQLNHSETL